MRINRHTNRQGNAPFITIGAFALLLMPAGIARVDAGDALRIECHERGVYAVTGSEMRKAGVDLSAIDPKKIALVHYDQSVPIHIEGAEDGRLDPEDTIYFFSQGSQDNDVVYVNIYETYYPEAQTFMLHLGDSAFKPKRFIPVEPRPSGAEKPDGYAEVELSGRSRFERDEFWEFVAHEYREKDRHDFLYWEKMTYPGTDRSVSDVTIPFNLPALETGGEALLEAVLYGPYRTHTVNVGLVHRLEIIINEKHKSRFSWHTKLGRVSVAIPPDVLRPGRNEVRFELLEPGNQNQGTKNPFRIDVVLLDWLSVTYEQKTRLIGGYNEFLVEGAGEREAVARFQISPFADNRPLVFDLGAEEILAPKLGPESRAGRTYALNLERTAADTTLVALDRRRCRKPYAIRKTHIKNLFDRSSDGELLVLSHPDFVENLAPFAEWKRSRGLAVEVVDITDIFNERTGGYATPFALRDYIQFLHETPDEPRLRYVLLVGDSVTISKYKTYLPAYAYLFSGTFSNDNFFANYNNYRRKPMLAVGRFSVTSETELRTIIEKVISYEKHENYGSWRANCFVITADDGWAKKDAKQLIRERIRPNMFASIHQTDRQESAADYLARSTQSLIDHISDGKLTTVFIGHGGGNVWEIGPTNITSGFKSTLFNQKSVERLTNGDKPTLVFSLTCYTNNFDDPLSRKTLGETFVNSPGGAIAVIGAAARSATSSNRLYLLHMFDLMREGKLERLGDYFAEAKRRIGWDNVNMNFQLLGDPSLEFSLPRADLELSEAHFDPSAGGIRFDYKLPETIKLPTTYDCVLIDSEENQRGDWTETLTSTTGSILLPYRDSFDQQGARVVVYIANGLTSDHCGAAMLTGAEVQANSGEETLPDS